MTTGEHAGNQDPRQHAQEVLNNSREALSRAVAIVSPENPDADPLEVFPAPGEVRNEDEGLSLTEQQAAELRAAVAPLGFERPTDVNLSALGLQGACVIVEGGQPHKEVAEARMVLEDSDARPSAIVLSASKHRKIMSDPEKASARRQFGEEPATEYDGQRRVGEGLEGFVAEEDEVLPFGYDIHNGFALVREATGQFVRIGRVGETPVIMMSIDREDYIDEGGNSKYRKQPGTADVIRIVDGMLAANGDEHSPIAFVTSGTYQPSRNVDAATVGLQTGRLVGVPTYGTERLGEVNGELPAPKRLDQLPGELRKMAEQVAKLESILAGE